MIITQTPLRVSFAGGGTDLADYYGAREGFVVNTGIDKSVFVIVNERYDDMIYVNYSRKEIVDKVDDLEHELVREAMKVTGVEGGVEVTMLSDIPSKGSGLGSSSSITVGLLNAFHVYRGAAAPPGQVAEEACDIEIVKCGKPIGKQDQYIASFGGISALTFRKDGAVEREKIELGATDRRTLQSNLFLFYTNQTRKADTILSEQKAKTSSNLDYLDGIKGLGFEARDCLKARNFNGLGEILGRNWEMKRQLASSISNEEIDRMYARALESGAIGGKICGAGGGGFLMAYCPPSGHERLREGMKEYRGMPISLAPDGSKVIFNYQRPSWK